MACENLPLPALQEIPSKKRSEARKRHEMTLTMIASLRSGLDAHRSPLQAATAGAVAAAGEVRQSAMLGEDDDYASAIA